MKHFKHYINGEFSDGSEQFETLNPANGKPWASFPAASEQESNLAIESAHAALYKGPWSKLTDCNTKRQANSQAWRFNC